MSFLPALTLVFIVLKLTSFIDWSWWLVLAPTLIPLALASVFASCSLYLSWYVARQQKKELRYGSRRPY